MVPGVSGTLSFRSLAVQVEGEVPVDLAAALEADWQRQTVGWPATSTVRVSPLEASARPSTARPVGARAITAQTQNGPLDLWMDGEGVRATGLSLETSASGSVVGLSAEVSPALLLLAFTEVQRAAGLLSLHASVLSRDGQTVAISGPSGAGKSTAALRLLGRGWQLVAEDWAWLDPATLRLVGWDSGLRLRPESLERFAPELIAGAPTDVHGKRVLSPPRLTGEQTLTGLYFLSATPSASRLELVRAVWGMVGAPLTPAARQATQAGVNRLMAALPMALIERNELVEELGV